MREDDRVRMTVLYNLLKQCDPRAFAETPVVQADPLPIDRSLVDKLTTSIFKGVHVDLQVHDQDDGSWISAHYNGNTLMMPIAGTDPGALRKVKRADPSSHLAIANSPLATTAA